MDCFAVKVDRSDVIAGISLYENLFRDSRYDITSVNFNSEKVHEDDIFVGQDILQFFSGESKDYKIFKILIDVIRTLNFKWILAIYYYIQYNVQQLRPTAQQFNNLIYKNK